MQMDFGSDGKAEVAKKQLEKQDKVTNRVKCDTNNFVNKGSEDRAGNKLTIFARFHFKKSWK